RPRRPKPAGTTSADHVRDSRCRQTSRKSAQRHMVEIIADGSGLSLLDQRLGRAAAKGRQGLRTVPGHGLLLAAGPVRYTADDLQHLAEPHLRLGRPAALGTVKRLAGKPGGLGELGLGHAESLHELVNDTLAGP